MTGLQTDPKSAQTFVFRTKRILRWAGIFLYYALGMVAIGAATGCAVFLILGPLFLKESSYGEIASYGLKTGAILAGIWTPGVAIVKCFVKGKKERDS